MYGLFQPFDYDCIAATAVALLGGAAPADHTNKTLRQASHTGEIKPRSADAENLPRNQFPTCGSWPFPTKVSSIQVAVIGAWTMIHRNIPGP